MNRTAQIFVILSLATLAAFSTSSAAASAAPNLALDEYLYKDKMVADIYVINFRNGCRAWGGTFTRKEYWPNPNKWDLITCKRD